VLEPGNYHIMLIDLVAPLEVGQTIEVSLEFQSAASQTVTVPVQAMGPMGTMDDDGADEDDADDNDDSDDDDEDDADPDDDDD
jgi:copper(I)-binding protein